jgi:hypothetical protein
LIITLIVITFFFKLDVVYAEGSFFKREEIAKPIPSVEKIIEANPAIQNTDKVEPQSSILKPKEKKPKPFVINNPKDIRSFFQNEGKGKFNCAYKGRKASTKCSVIYKTEFVDHVAFLKWNGNPADAKVITIYWPDGDISRYTEIDSGELINLSDDQPGGYHLAGDEVEQDWNNGYVIQKDGVEHVRLLMLCFQCTQHVFQTI